MSALEIIGLIVVVVALPVLLMIGTGLLKIDVEVIKDVGKK